MRKIKKSSRKRMEGRTNRRTQSSPALTRVNNRDGIALPNRPMRKESVARKKQAVGIAVRSEMREIRKLKLKKARRALSKLKKQIRQALKKRLSK